MSPQREHYFHIEISVGCAIMLLLCVFFLEPLKSPVRYLYEFLEVLLADPKYSQLIAWKSKEERIFMLVDHNRIAHMWGMHKRKKPMSYDKFSRALRFYYSKNILKKENGRFTYRFLIKETDLVNLMPK